MPDRVGRYTLKLRKQPIIVGFAAVTGPKEAQGPLGTYFDKTFDDSLLNEKTWEKSESKLQGEAVTLALQKANKDATAVDFIFAGDLLNQCISSTFGLKNLNIPFLGQYGACSTMAQTLAMASLMISTGCAATCVAVTSSHFCSAERQFRFPIDYGSQRTPTAQWTVTGSGAMVLSEHGTGPKVSDITIGKIVDLGIKDANNMGAAMAPAAACTIKQYFDDTNTSPQDYDFIFTGDLGETGSKLLYELLQKENIDIASNHNDCGLLIFDQERQDVHAGGSGCGCGASVLCSKILTQLKTSELKNILFVATGALMSPTSSQQGESIPGIAHLVHIIA